MDLRMLLAAGTRLSLVAALTAQASALDLQHPCPSLTLPFDMVSNFEVVVQGQIGEQDGLRFILDTGSSHSVIDRRVADRIGLHRRPGKVFNFDRDLAIEWADVPDVRIGPMRIASVPMKVARLAEISEFADNVDGIIGLDVLSRARKIGIDYERRRVSFELDEGCGSRPSAVKSFLVTVVVQGIPLRLQVDTGLQYILLYRDSISSALPHLRIEGEPRDAMIGRLQATQVNLRGVQVLGPNAVTPVFLIESPGKTDLGGIDGYLGSASLHAKRLELDFAEMILRWQ
ncbi:MAG: retropepsin-like aspartic protease [Terracidiphilus sp.]|jgi:predicted aspartyl protease